MDANVAKLINEQITLSFIDVDYLKYCKIGRASCRERE